MILLPPGKISSPSLAARCGAGGCWLSLTEILDGQNVWLDFSVHVQDRDRPGELADIPGHLLAASGDKSPLQAPFQVLEGAWPEVEPHHILPGDEGLKGKEDRGGGRRKRFQDSAIKY